MLARKSLLLSALLALVTSSYAHFQLQFPEPRGPFVEDDEPNFCDGYTNAVDNRSTFPLGQGFITMNSEHPKWSIQVLISVEQNPTNFSVFNTSTSGQTLPLAVQPFQASGEGLACFAIDIQNLGIQGVQDGSNVTIQVEFNGGDDNLFQCADLTLSSSATIPSNVSCTNLVSNSTTSSANGTSTSTSASSTSTESSAALSLFQRTGWLLGLLAIAALSLL
ncbi:hypothetical protein ACEPAH_710 [Sanghuangporus vaninii]